MDPYNTYDQRHSTVDTVEFVQPEQELVDHVRRSICLTRARIRGEREIMVFADSKGEALPIVPRAWRLSTYPFAGKREKDT